MDIRLFTCSFGAGHMRAADYIASIAPAHRVERIDITRFLFPLLADGMYHMYTRMMRTQGMGYRAYLAGDRHKKKDALTAKLLIHRFARHMDAMATPDAFVATFSTAAWLLAEYKKKRGLSTPLIVCITDFEPHDFWVNEGTDLYLVASSYTERELQKFGVPKEKIVVVGLSPRRAAAHLTYERAHRVLVTGGGLGLLPRELGFYRTITALYGEDVRVVTGRNKSLYKRLRQARIPGVTVLGFVDMERELDRADIVIGKAGGLSTYEAIMAETPIVYIDPFLPQEKKNARFIDSEKIGSSFGEVVDRDTILAQREEMRRIKAEADPAEFQEYLEAFA